MKIVTAQEMKRIDQGAMEKFGMPSLTLMENAGTAVANFILKRYKKLSRVLVFCGRGNNGGDGLVVARKLKEKGKVIQIYLLASREELRGEAKINLEKISQLPLTEIKTEKDLAKINLTQGDLVVDALLGTGLSKEVKGTYKLVIEKINRAGKTVIAIDIPSGLSADSGEVLGEAVKASATITLGLPKIGIVIPRAKNYVGEWVVDPIGIPPKLLDDSRIKNYLIERGEIRQLLPRRREDSHKGSWGHLVLIAGSVGKGGAAVMASRAAFRSGVGLVTLLTDKETQSMLIEKLKEVMIEEFKKENLSQQIDKKEAIAIGPGIGVTEKNRKLLFSLIKKAFIPMVIDADGLSLLENHLEILNEKKGTIVLTPHPGEMARLLKRSAKGVQENRFELARTLAKQYKVIVVLKGSGTIIASPNGDCFLNPTGTPAMAVAGMGDILTGMIGSFICQGVLPLEAAKLAVYLHGLAGELVSEKLGDRGLMADDLINQIPAAIRSLLV